MLAGTKKNLPAQSSFSISDHVWFAKTLETQSTGLEIAALLRGGL